MVTRLEPSELAGLDPDALEQAAGRCLPPDVFDYYRTGARDERTLAANREAWASLWFVPRRLTGVDGVSLEVDLLGQRVPHPIVVGPTAGHGLAYPEGEVATARAASSCGATLVLSTSSSRTVEDVGAVANLDLWFQLYPFEDRDKTELLIGRAVAAGARAIVLTVDVPTDVSTHARPPGGWKPGPDVTWAHHDGNEPGQRRLDWASVRWMAEAAGRPVILKGVLHPDDARRAADEGFAGVVVSNHGGRTLDAALPTAVALPRVVAAAGSAIEVFVDGGIRRGGDVLKALALGARAVFVGRPVLWGLACAGEAGVCHVLSTLRDELAVDSAMADVSDLRDVPPDLVVRAGDL